MKIMKTWAPVSGDGVTDFHLVDTIEHEGKLWLVPTWIEGMTMPERIVCLSNLRHQKSGVKGRDFVLARSIPRAVLFGHVLPEHKAEYLIIERPPIRMIRGRTGLR
jgi:hypothetical protein